LIPHHNLYMRLTRYVVLVLATSVVSTCAAALPAYDVNEKQTWSWSIEDVDVTPARFTALAVDQEGSVHVAYAAGAGGYDLKYAFRPAGSAKWFTMQLEKEYSNFATNIGIDKKGNPHVCFTPRQMRYASWNGKSWEVQQVDAASGGVEYSCSMAFGSDGTPHLAWYQTHTPANTLYLHIKYATLKDGVWMARTLDFDRECGKWNSVVVDDEGRPHIAYSVFPPGELKYGWFDGKEWRFTLVDTPHQGATRYAVGLGVSLAQDQKKQFFMSYYESPYSADVHESGMLKVAKLEGGKWKITVVDQVEKTTGWAEYNSQIAFDSHGNPHVSYEDGGGLKHAFWDGEQWRVQLIVGATGEALIYSSMKVAPDDTVFISYRDPNDSILRVAVGRPMAQKIAKSAAVAPDSPKH